MAKLYYTADDLVESIRRRAQLPINNNTFNLEDYLKMADEEISLSMLPSIIRQHENYFLHSTDVPLVVDQARYKIPYRAAGNKLKDLAYLDNAGNIIEMVRIPVEHISDYNGSSYNVASQINYYVMNDEIVLFPENVKNPVGALRFIYYLRPNQLVKLNKVGKISAIDPINKTISLSNLPTEFTSSLLYDFVDIESPHRTLDFDVPVVSINSSTKLIQFDTDYTFPTRLKVGDHVCIQCETAIPQIPDDLHPMLAHKVAMAALESLGDTEGLANASQKYGELQNNMTTLVDNRVEGSPQKLVNRNSFLRRANYRRRNGR